MEEIIAQLKRKGYRITKIRKEIIKILNQKEHVLICSRDILKKLKVNRILADRTTVYRELKFLVKNNFVCEIMFRDGLTRYELLINHHHHLFCLDCKKIEEIATKDQIEPLLLEEKKISKKTGFLIKNHNLEFYGLCNKCIKK